MSIDEWAGDSVEITGTSIDAPTLSLALKWLSEEYGFIILIYPAEGWSYRIQEYDEPFKNYKYPFDNENIKDTYDSNIHYDTYEQALSAGIDKCIEVLNER